MFKCFRGDAASMKPPFCGVPELSPLPPAPPKFDSSLLKFWPEVISYQTKTISKQSFKIKCLSRNGTYPKLKVLVHFAAQFKPEIMPKTKIFPETTSLWILNNTSTRSQINHRILIKLIKKIHFWGKNGLFKIKNRPVKKIKRSEVRLEPHFQKPLIQG